MSMTHATRRYNNEFLWKFEPPTECNIFQRVRLCCFFCLFLFFNWFYRKVIQPRESCSHRLQRSIYFHNYVCWTINAWHYYTSRFILINTSFVFVSLLRYFNLLTIRRSEEKIKRQLENLNFLRTSNSHSGEHAPPWEAWMYIVY